jgi:hypothetical protein
MDKRFVTAIVVSVILLHEIEVREQKAPHLHWEPPTPTMVAHCTPAATGTYWLSVNAGAVPQSRFWTTLAVASPELQAFAVEAPEMKHDQDENRVLNPSTLADIGVTGGSFTRYGVFAADAVLVKPAM